MPLALTSLAVGNRYYAMAAACMKTARQFLGTKARYVIFHAGVSPATIDRYPDYQPIDITELLEETHSVSSLKQNPLEIRRFKFVPLSHPAVADDDVLFLDADTLVFEDRFQELKAKISAESVVIFGGYRDDDFELYASSGHPFNLKKRSAESLSVSVRNMVLNSGLIGRSCDEDGTRFGVLLRHYMMNKVLEPFRPGYFNDEPYVMLAYQVALGKRVEQMDPSLPPRLYCTTHGSRFINDAPNWPDVFKIVSGEGLVRKPAMIHFVQTTNSSTYLRLLKSVDPQAVGPGEIRKARWQECKQAIKKWLKGQRTR